MTARHPSSTAVRAALTADPRLAMFCTYQQDDMVELFGAQRMVRLPIAENAMVGMAMGMALAGRPVLVSIARAAFLFTALDPLVNHAATWRYMSDGQFSVPLVIRGFTRGGEYLGAQHEHTPHALLSQVPGLVVAVPGSPNSAAGLLATALRHPDPVVVLESPRLYSPDWASLPESDPTPDPLPFGVAGRARPGRDVTLVGIGNTVATCLSAAAELTTSGVDCQVVDLRTAAPLDRDGVAGMVADTRAAVLVDEAPRQCSVMADLGLELLHRRAVPPERLAVLHGRQVPAPASPHLLAPLLPTTDGLVQVVRAVVDGAPPEPADFPGSVAGGESRTVADAAPAAGRRR